MVAFAAPVGALLAVWAAAIVAVFAVADRVARRHARHRPAWLRFFVSTMFAAGAAVWMLVLFRVLSGGVSRSDVLSGVAATLTMRAGFELVFQRDR